MTSAQSSTSTSEPASTSGPSITSQQSSSSTSEQASVSGPPMTSAQSSTSTSEPASTSGPSTSELASCAVAVAGRLRYPTSVQQRGRPAKRKQRLFNASKKTLIYEKLSAAKRDEMRLALLVPHDSVEDIVQGRLKVELTDLQISDSGLAILSDDRACANELKQYFTVSAWQAVTTKLQSYDISTMLCSLCKQAVPNRPSTSVKWVQCDACIAWCHISCTGLNRMPKGVWFCVDCE